MVRALIVEQEISDSTLYNVVKIFKIIRVHVVVLPSKTSV